MVQRQYAMSSGGETLPWAEMAEMLDDCYLVA